MTVDGAARPKNHRVAAGERVAVEAPSAEARRPRRRRSTFEIVYEDDDLIVVDKPAGVVTHPAPGHRGPTLAEALAAGRPAARPRARRDRAPARPRHLGPAGRRASEEAHARAPGDDEGARGHARVHWRSWRAIRTPSAARSTPRSAATARNRTVMSTRTDRAARRGHPFRGRWSGFRAPRCCACGSKPGARTRSARTSPRSATRSCGDPQYGGSRKRPQARPEAPISSRFETDV